MTTTTPDRPRPTGVTGERSAPGLGTARLAPPGPVSPGVWFVAAAATGLLLVVAPRYGWHRDELYFLEAGRHLQWGYVDQPPFTPFVARLADLVAPGNLVVLRLLPALAAAATVALGGLTVRELGGGRVPQVLGAAATASAGFVLGSGHLLSTATFDLTAWMAMLWLVTRLLRTADPRWWVPVGGVAGLAALNKNLVFVLAAALAGALVAERRRDLLLTPWLPAGALLALTISAPHLAWQAGNGWPQAEMARALEQRIGAENRATLLPLQVLLVGPPLVALWAWGVRWLTGDPGGRRFRPLLWTWLSALVLVFATGGRPYYAVAPSLVVMLAGVRAAAGTRPSSVGRLVAVNAVGGLLIGLPLLPADTIGVTAAVNETAAESVGWPELADQVAAVVGVLPADERERIVLLAGTYGEAGAIDRFGPALGLPEAYSPHNGYWDFRRPADDGATVVAVRFSVGELGRHFDSCSQVATVDNGRGVDNEAQGAPILVCRGLRGSWAEVWGELRRVS